MQKIMFVSLVILTVLFNVSDVFSWEITPSADIRNAGEIHGIAAYCGIGGSAGLELYIPGRSFFAKTGPTGEFTLSYVPEGTYNLVFRLSDTVI